jgi:hypothetical protein
LPLDYLLRTQLLLSINHPEGHPFLIHLAALHLLDISTISKHLINARTLLGGLSALLTKCQLSTQDLSSFAKAVTMQSKQLSCRWIFKHSLLFLNLLQQNGFGAFESLQFSPTLSGITWMPLLEEDINFLVILLGRSQVHLVPFFNHISRGQDTKNVPSKHKVPHRNPEPKCTTIDETTKSGEYRCTTLPISHVQKNTGSPIRL